MANASVNYECPSCGAPLKFSPGDAKVTCEYCGTAFETAAVEQLFAEKEAQAAEAARAKEAKWETEKAGGAWGEEAAGMQVQTCAACGAELVSDGNTMATQCAYCGSANLLPAKFSGELRPDVVIPFKKTKADAIAALKEFYRGKKLLPSGFLSESRVKEIQAMYVPFWLFDTEAAASALFDARRVRCHETADEVITETSFYSCERAGTMRFRAIPVDGSERMDDAFMESIEPFDYAGLVEFSPACLTGFLADKYDVDAEKAAPRADARVEKSALALLSETVTGYDTVTQKSGAVRKEGGRVRYALVPVWILTARYEGRPYTFMMNGQTGKVVGSLPIDARKAKLYPLAFALVSLPIFYFAAKALLA